jgi:hypothetical protein
MISADAKDAFKVLLQEPTIDRSEVSSIVTESVAKIAAMNQHVTGQRTKLFVFAMSVAYQNNSQLSVPRIYLTDNDLIQRVAENDFPI